MWSGLENALSEAQLCMDHAKDNLAAFEIGNEPDIAVAEGEASGNYTLADYVAKWLDFADAISEKILKGNTYGLPEQRFFQALTYSSYDDNGFSVYVDIFSLLLSSPRTLTDVLRCWQARSIC